MLSIKGIDCFYGDLQVLWGVSLEVEEKTISAVIGSNGAGKTTLLKSIVGLTKAKSGVIMFQGERIDYLRPYQIAAMGISMVPEGRRLFSEMTVLENLELGAYAKFARNHVNANITWIFDLFPRLRDRIDQKAVSLSGGEQQMLAIGRALMAMPKLLILDEPSLGLMPILTEVIFEVITEIKVQGVTVLLVEQNVAETLSRADRYYILETGRIIHDGLCKDFIKHEQLRKAYLGW
jgi:branched-chain amino acid transport system ATP-binding protein